MSIAEKAEATGLDRTTVRLILIVFVLSIIHIADHALRVDHSGWPFRPDVTPFTYSLLVFPMLLFALFGPRRLYWVRWALFLLATVATLYAHVLIETPHMQYAMWAHDRSSDPHQQGFHNVPDVSSPTLGVLSTIVAMTLNVMTVVTTIAMFVQGRRAELPNQGGRH